MRVRYEFRFYESGGSGSSRGVDRALAQMGAKGWEIRGVAALKGDAVLVALQRVIEGKEPLPDAPTLAASLAEPFLAPDPA